VDIASITPYSPATALGNLGGNFNVTGQITDSTGFLLINWTYPGEAESGNLTCEANGIDAAGHTSRFSTDLVIGVQEPSLTDLVSHVHRQEILLVQQAADNKHLSDQLTQHTSTISDQGKQLSQQSAIIANQTQDIAQLKTCACNHGNDTQVLSGIIDCGSSTRWPSGTYTKSVTFSTAYDNKPVVHLSPVQVQQAGASNQVLSYVVEVTSVTPSSFTMRCRVASTSSVYRLNDLKVSWVSFPQ